MIKVVNPFEFDVDECTTVENIELQNFTIENPDLTSTTPFKVIRIPQEGNCQFESIEKYFFFVEGLLVKHEDIRYNAINEMEKFKDEYIGFFDDTDYVSYEQYVSCLANTGVWGDNLTLKAIAQAYQLNIKVFSFNAPVVKIIIKKGQPFCNLFFSSKNSHYDLIIGEPLDNSFYKK
jgi:hypothetical protein